MNRRTSVERRMEKSGCDGKRRFKTEADAQRELDAIMRSRLAKNYDGVRPYACPFCGTWHLGHPKDPVLAPRDPIRVCSGEVTPPVMRDALRKAGLVE